MLSLMSGLRWVVRSVLVGFLLSAVPGTAALADGPAIGALVTDLTGSVVLDGANQDPLTILSGLRPDARVRLAPGAQLTVLVYESGDEFIFSGPSVVQFRSMAPQVLQGAEPVRRPSPYAQLVKGGLIGPSGLSQATFVMRGIRKTVPIKVISPIGLRVVDSTPGFRWVAVEPNATYRFELADEAGNIVFHLEGQDTSIMLSASNRLKDGVNYSWRVSARGRDGTAYLGGGIVGFASSELRAQIGRIRPASSAPVSERVAFASWLMQVGLGDEARTYWKALSAERPQDAQIKALADE